MKIAISRPEKKMKDFRSTGTGKKLLENPYYEKRVDGPLTLVPLATGMAITKDYGSYDMTYSSANRFGKYVKGEGRTRPSAQDILHFRRAINSAALRDSRIQSFLENNPDLKIESWQL